MFNHLPENTRSLPGNMSKKLRLALLISGGGTTAQAIIKACRKGDLKIDPSLVITSKSGIGGIEKALALNIPKEDVIIINPNNCNGDEFGKKLIGECKKRNIDIIGQYGWLPLTPKIFIDEYKGRIINQHPGPLDPGREDFGGKGMYGRRVHAAVLYFRRVTRHDFWTEAVTHFVTDQFDKGGVIKNKKIKILPTDTVVDLQARVLLIEHEVQIEALRDFANGNVKIIKRRKPLIKNSEVNILNRAKEIAAIFYPNG